MVKDAGHPAATQGCIPPSLQKQFEREADEFAAEVFFFGRQFVEDAMSLPFGLAAPVQLANGPYDVSLHAGFTRYVKQNTEKCCLLVSSPVLNIENGLFDLELRNYTKSDGFGKHIPPHQIVSGDSPIGQLYNSGSLANVVEYEVTIGGQYPEVYQANSFTNGYNVFTLIWNPKPA